MVGDSLGIGGGGKGRWHIGARLGKQTKGIPQSGEFHLVVTFLEVQ